jgi:hypothetical protein
MNNLNNKSSISSIIQNNIILVFILIFTIVYLIINYDKIMNGITKNIDVGNTLLITIITVLILYLLTLDDEIVIKEETDIPKFKLNDINNVVEKDIKGGSKYKIANNIYSSNFKKVLSYDNSVGLQGVSGGAERNTIPNINDFDNTNIFISQKHLGKYGIKF